MIGDGRKTVDSAGFSPTVMPVVIPSHDCFVPFVPSSVTIGWRFFSQGEGMGCRSDSNHRFPVRDVLADHSHGLVRKGPSSNTDEK